MKILVSSIVLCASLYGVGISQCTGCHGVNFEKSALGTSRIVRDMSENDIIKTLNGYKNRSYGGKMKGVMEGQVRKFTDIDIKLISKEIKNLK